MSDEPDDMDRQRHVWHINDGNPQPEIVDYMDFARAVIAAHDRGWQQCLAAVIANTAGLGRASILDVLFRMQTLPPGTIDASAETPSGHDVLLEALTS